MIKRIEISNFRSIKNAVVDISPLTVLYGPTSSGKSSLLYALLVLKNFIVNPNQQSDGFFNFGFMNLGGFDQCVFNHEKENAIEIYLSLNIGGYGISLTENSGEISMITSPYDKMKAKVSIPYALNKNFLSVITEKEVEFNVNWNGISTSVSPKEPTAETQEIAFEIAQ
ncbi:MAG: AAA family ATPase, partial [bacterium]